MEEHNWTGYLGSTGEKLIELFNNNTFTPPSELDDYNAEFGISSDNDTAIYQTLKDLSLEELTVDWFWPRFEIQTKNLTAKKSLAFLNYLCLNGVTEVRKGSKALLLEFRNTSNKDIKEFYLPS